MQHERSRDEDPTIHRKKAAEERALTTGGGITASASGGGGAAFVLPAILLKSWAEYRSPYRAFADQCQPQEMPTWGMELYVPIVTTGTSVTTQTEGSTVSESSPVAALTNGAVVTKAGQVVLTQQWLDRAGSGIDGDVVLFEQLRNQLDAQIDAYAIAQAIAKAQTVSNTGSFALTGTSGVGGFLADLKSAKKKLTDTAGVRLRGTHAFATSDFCDYIAAYADAQGRPVFSPTLDDNRLPIRSVGDPLAEGFTGYILDGLCLFADDSIANSGSNTQIIVARPDTVLLYEGSPIPYCSPPTVAGSLEAVLGVRAYTATIPLYPEGVATISGKAYEASQFS
jgi:hypothetical protein